MPNKHSLPPRQIPQTAETLELSEIMVSLYRKWLFTGLLLLCFAPASFAGPVRACDHYRQRNCQPTQQVPEGGSSATYLLGAGLVCAGAMFARFRMQRAEIR